MLIVFIVIGPKCISKKNLFELIEYKLLLLQNNVNPMINYCYYNDKKRRFIEIYVSITFSLVWFLSQTNSTQNSFLIL